MEKLQVNTKEYIIYSPDSLNYITDNMLKILDDSFNFYKLLFGVSDFRKVQINYFDNLDKFREYIYSLRGERDSLPEYARGTFDQGMINAFISTNVIKDTPLYNKKLYMASHELFHIMYKELVWEKEDKKRIVWFDEGMAQFFSGEYKNILNDDNFKKWLGNLICSTEIIPDLNELSHGDSFENSKYSGYKLSLLAVKYLYETIGFDEFRILMHDIDKIECYGKTVINDAINFYQDNLSKTGLKK